MCVLVLVWRCRRDLPLVVAANRDEERGRPAAPPERCDTGRGSVLAPCDLRAGGTWEGLAANGLVVVITNRRDGDFDAGRPSRGSLCREALQQPDARAVESWLVREVRRQRYNSFNLFYADRDRAFVSSWNGDFESRSLEPGLHTLSNLHALDELELVELRVPGAPDESVGDLRRRLRAVLGSHDRRDAAGFEVCKHGAHYGTVSSSLFFVPAAAAAWMEHAEGLPCTAVFERYGFETAPPR